MTSSFRFAIADNSVRSEVWSVFTNKNDVYLTGSAYKRVLKVSLHQSGVCQIAMLEGFFAEHIEGNENAPEFRDMFRWRRLPSKHMSGQMTFSVGFASFDFWPEQDNPPKSKPFTKIAPPPNGYSCHVDLAYSLDDPTIAAKLGGWTEDLLHSFQLPNLEYVCLMKRIEKLPANFFDFSRLQSKMITLGIDEPETADARGISVFDCYQSNEGHCHVRSLHNMRLITVRLPILYRILNTIRGWFSRSR